MATYTFKSVLNGSAKFKVDSDQYHLIEDGDIIDPVQSEGGTYNSLLIIGHSGRHIIKLLTDTVIADATATGGSATTYSPGSNIDTVYDALNPFFNIANTGAGGLPELTLSVISDTQINASWTTVPGAVGYTLQRSVNSDFSGATTVYTGTATSFNDTGLTASTTYYYRIKANIDTSYISKSSATQVTQNVTPAAPTIVTDTNIDTVDATHTLGDSEILVSVNNGAYTAFSGTPIYGQYIDRAAGYYKFKIKAATGRNESAVASSPAFTGAFDYYVSSTGNDGNNGTSSGTAYATIAPIQTKITALTSGQTLRVSVSAGTYEGTLTNSSGFNPAAVTRVVVACFGKVIFDNSNYLTGAAADTISFVDVDGNSNNQWYLYGNPDSANRTEIKGNGAARFNNGLATHSSAKLYAFNFDIHGYFDGVSAHATSYMYRYNLYCYGNGKTAIADVNTCVTLSDICRFEGMQSATVGVGQTDATTTTVFNDCELYNPVGVTTGTNAFYNATFNRCKIGKLTQGTYGSYWQLDKSTFNDCFVNISYQSLTAGTTTWNRCYGFMTSRPRKTPTTIHIFNHCVFKTGYAAIGNFVFWDVGYSAGTEDGGLYTVKNSIFVSHTKVFNTTNVAAKNTIFNTNWTITNNCYYLNTAIADTGATNHSTNAVLTNPLLVNPTTELQADWKVSAGSPTLGAGEAGSDIGLGV